LGNLLLVAGAAMVVGGWNREKQVFSRTTAEVNAGLLVMCVAAMLFPAIYHHSFVFHAGFVAREHAVSFGTSIILLIVYALGLVFTLRTHSHLFTVQPAQSPEDPNVGISAMRGEHWTVRRSITMLLIASLGIGLVAELLVGRAEVMATQ